MNLKTKKEQVNNNRNYFNSFGDYDYCFINTCGSKHCDANRRKWNINTGPKSKK